MSLFREGQWRKASWEQQSLSVFPSDRVAVFHPYRENCSLCPPSDLRDTSCTLPGTCLLHRLLPPAAQIIGMLPDEMEKEFSQLTGLDSVGVEKGLQGHLNHYQFCNFYWKFEITKYKKWKWNNIMALLVIQVCCGPFILGFFIFLLTSFSAPILLVYAASLKHCMQTALSFTTLSASGTRFRMFPKGCKDATPEWVIIRLKTQNRCIMLWD